MNHKYICLNTLPVASGRHTVHTFAEKQHPCIAHSLYKHNL